MNKKRVYILVGIAPRYMKYFFEPGAIIRACVKERQQKSLCCPSLPTI